MRRWHAGLLALFLATAVHVDWHLARPTHHRLSLGWEQHWLFAAAAFALVGWAIARRWPDRPWRAAAGIVAGALVIAQVIEPMMEVLAYQGRWGYPGDPGRWGVFMTCVAAGLPAMALALVTCRPRQAPDRLPAA